MKDLHPPQRGLFRGLGEDALIKVGNVVADVCDAQGYSYDDEPYRTIIQAVADELAQAYPLGAGGSCFERGDGPWCLGSENEG